MKEKISITVDKGLLKEVDKLIDHINIKNRSHAIEYLVQRAIGGNRSAVVLCGGPAETLRVGNQWYRPTVPLGRKRLIEHTLEKLSENQFKRVFIIGRKALLTSVFDIIGSGSDYGVDITYIQEKSSRGTASSLRLIKGEVNAPFLIVNGDVVINKLRIDELWEAHIKNRFMATLFLTSSPDPSKKGIVKLEGSRVLQFDQKPKAANTFIGFSSLFVCEPELLNINGDWLELDIFPELAKKGQLGGHVSSERELHIHTKEDLGRVSKLFRKIFK